MILWIWRKWTFVTWTHLRESLFERQTPLVTCCWMGLPLLVGGIMRNEAKRFSKKSCPSHSTRQVTMDYFLLVSYLCVESLTFYQGFYYALFIPYLGSFVWYQFNPSSNKHAFLIVYINDTKALIQNVDKATFSKS